MVDTDMDLQALLIVGQHDRSTCEPTWIGVDHKINHRAISNEQCKERTQMPTVERRVRVQSRVFTAYGSRTIESDRESSKAGVCELMPAWSTSSEQR